jgi:hypothetical protein
MLRISSLDSTKVKHGGAQAALFAAKRALSMDKLLILEGDSSSVIMAINDPNLISDWYTVYCSNYKRSNTFLPPFQVGKNPKSLDKLKEEHVMLQSGLPLIIVLTLYLL